VTKTGTIQSLGEKAADDVPKTREWRESSWTQQKLQEGGAARSAVEEGQSAHPPRQEMLDRNRDLSEAGKKKVEEGISLWEIQNEVARRVREGPNHREKQNERRKSRRQRARRNSYWMAQRRTGREKNRRKTAMAR